MTIEIGGGLLQLSRSGVSLTIRNSFFKGDGFSASTLLEMPSDFGDEITEILIDGEKISQPISREDIIKCLAGRSGRIRLGFCSACGAPAPYEEDMITWNHPEESYNIIACILKS